MQCIAFAALMVPGKTDIDRAAMEACARGERKAEHAASRRRHGITRESVWIQTTPAGDMAVVYLEADDLEAAFAGLGASEDPFDRWFRAVVHEVHRIDLTEGFPPPEQVMDYRGTAVSGEAPAPDGAAT
jgi:hypothetical protein